MFWLRVNFTVQQLQMHVSKHKEHYSIVLSLRTWFKTIINLGCTIEDDGKLEQFKMQL